MKKVNDDWSCIGSESISPYAEVCTEAVQDDNIFKKFKSDSRYIAITENVLFEGASFNIDGDGNLLSGSMYMGSVEGSGIELHGGSAYMRSLGYNGFDRTIAENKGGFLIFSGSVSQSLSTSQSYDGVGLELVDAHGSTDRYLRFRTNPSLFEVVTDTFFLGVRLEHL